MELVPAVQWRLPLGGQQKGRSSGSHCGGLACPSVIWLPQVVQALAAGAVGCGAVWQQAPRARCAYFWVREPLDFQVPAHFPGSGTLPGSSTVPSSGAVLEGMALLQVDMSSEGRAPGLNQSAGGGCGLSASIATWGMEEMVNGSCRHSEDDPGCRGAGSRHCVSAAWASGTCGGAATVRDVQTPQEPVVAGALALILWRAGTAGLGSLNNSRSPHMPGAASPPLRAAPRVPTSRDVSAGCTCGMQGLPP